MTIRVPASLRLTVPLILLGFAATLSAFNFLYHVPRAERAAEQESRKRLAQEMSRLQSTLEYLLLKGLHKQQEAEGFHGIRAGELVLQSTQRAYPEQENVPKTVFGGYLVRRAYELAALAAELVAPDRVVPFQVNRINFNQPVLLGDQLKFTARVVYTGKTTITVQSDIERFGRVGGDKALSNSCLFTFRNVDANMEPQPVPFIYPVTYAEDARFLNAYRQRVD